MNLFGPIRVTKAFLPLIRKSQGRIINVSSLLDRIVTPLMSPYCITKVGLSAFSDVLRLEMKQFNVKVCVIEPGNYMTVTAINGEDGLIGSARRFCDQSSPSVQQIYGEASMMQELSELHEVLLKLSVSLLVLYVMSIAIRRLEHHFFYLDRITGQRYESCCRGHDRFSRASASANSLHCS